jgi:hypothetical protein
MQTWGVLAVTSLDIQATIRDPRSNKGLPLKDAFKTQSRIYNGLIKALGDFQHLLRLY